MDVNTLDQLTNDTLQTAYDLAYKRERMADNDDA